MTFDEKIKMLNDYAIAWYSSSQADYIHEATFRGQGFGKFADCAKFLQFGCSAEEFHSCNHPFSLTNDWFANRCLLTAHRIPNSAHCRKGGFWVCGNIFSAQYKAYAKRFAAMGIAKEKSALKQ